MKAMVRVALWAVLLGLTAAAPSRAVWYQARYLNTPDGQFSEARAVNDRGDAAGAIEYPKRAAIVPDGGVVEPLPQESWVKDMNSGGQIVGWFYDALCYMHIYLWSDEGGLTDLQTLGGVDAEAHAINDETQVVGYIGFGWQFQNRIEGFVWSPRSGVTYLGTLGGRNSEAVDINNTGQVVGRANTPDGKEHAFLWSDGMGMIDLTPNSSGSGADAINDTGQVVGWSHIDAEHYEVFLWSSEHGMRTIATYSNDIGIRPRAINDHGAVVGSLADVDGSEKAFVWSNDTGFTILGNGVAYDINNAGQIAGMMFDSEGGYNAVLWEPVPETSSLAGLVGLSLLAAGGVRGKRKG